MKKKQKNQKLHILNVTWTDCNSLEIPPSIFLYSFIINHHRSQKFVTIYFSNSRLSKTVAKFAKILSSWKFVHWKYTPRPASSILLFYTILYHHQIPHHHRSFASQYRRFMESSNQNHRRVSVPVITRKQLASSSSCDFLEQRYTAPAEDYIGRALPRYLSDFFSVSILRTALHLIRLKWALNA